jgi:hypothetical protein
MKLLKRILLRLGIAAFLIHSVYLTARVHDLDARLRATVVRVRETPTGELRIHRKGPGLVPDSTTTEVPLAERLRRLEDDLHPKMRLLGEK